MNDQSFRHEWLAQIVNRWPASRAFLVAFATVATAILIVTMTITVLQPGAVALPVTVKVSGGHGISLLAADHKIEPNSSSKGITLWKIEDTWISDLKVDLPAGALEALTNVEIDIGSRNFSWDRASFLEAWDKEGEASYTAPWNARATPGPQIRSIFDEWVRNWPGNLTMLAAVLKFPLAGGLLAGLAAAAFAARSNVSAPSIFFSVSTSFAGPAAERTWSPAALTLIGCSLVVILLEFREPLYFMRDDNLAQFGPVITKACGSLVTGIFPAWNPNQFLGAPAADLGIYALTYPPTYLSCAAAGLLNEPLATIDIFVIVHLFVAAFGVLALLKRLAVTDAIAVIAAIAYAFNGYMLVTGRSWYYMAPTAALIPWLLYFHHRLQHDNRPLVSAVGFALALGAMFHGGNAQMWVYALLLLGILTLLQLPAADRPLTFLARFAIAGTGGISLALPLLIPQLALLGEVIRDVPVGRGFRGFDFTAVFLPYPFNLAPALFGTQGRAVSIESYHMSLPLAAFWLIGLAAFAVVRRPWRVALSEAAWGLVALTAFFLAGGPRFGLWSLLHALPGLQGFQHPFKFVILMNGFIVVAGAVAISRWALDRKRLRIAVAALSISFLWHIGVTHQASHYGYPYPPERYWDTPPSDPIKAAQRIHVIAPERSPSPSYINALPQNWATLYGVRTTGGYDPLLEQSRQGLFFAEMMRTIPVEVLRAYGVDRLVIHETSFNPRYGKAPGFWIREELTSEAFLVLDALRADDRIQILKYGNDLRMASIPGAYPMAFRADTGTALPYVADWSGVHVDVRGVPAGTTIVANWMDRRAFKAGIDGALVAKSADPWNRLAATLPAAASRLDFAYRAPWMLGFVAGVVGILLSILAWIATDKSSRDRLFAKTPLPGIKAGPDKGV